MTDPDRFDRLPEATETRDMPSREAVLEFWDDRFGVAPTTFDDHTFWRKGADSVWAVAGEEAGPVAVETLGLRLLRTGGHDWKPTTNAAQRFAADASRNVAVVSRRRARRFVRGASIALDWSGDRGYLIVATEIAGGQTVLGVGLFADGELRSQVPKSRRVEFPEP